MTEVQAPIQGPVEADLTPPKPVIPTKSADSADSSQTIEAAKAIADALAGPENLNIPEDQRLYESSQILHVVAGRTLTEGEKSKAEPTTGQKSLNAVSVLMDHQANPNAKFKKFNVTSVPPLIIADINGKNVASAKGSIHVVSLDEKMTVGGKVHFKCTLTGGRIVEIDADELIRAQVFAKGGVMLEAIKDEKTRSLMTKYFDHLKDPTESFEVTDDQMKEVAVQNGMISSESAKVMAASIADETVRARILSDLDGRNIASIENVTEIMMHASTMGVEKQAITAAISSYEAKIIQHQQIIDNLGEVEGEAARELIAQRQSAIASLRGEIKGKERELADAEKFKKQMIKYEKNLIDSIKSAYDGKMDLATAQTLDKAIRDKDMTKLMETLVSQLGNDERSQELKEMAASALKMGGIGALAIVALMIMQAVTAK